MTRLCSYLDESFSYYDSSSPEGAQSSAASKNIVSERNRRKKLNERLFALRAVVPNISKVRTEDTFGIYCWKMLFFFLNFFGLMTATTRNKLEN